MGFLDLRVGDAPIVSNSRATTRILLPDVTLLPPGKQPAPLPEPPKTHGDSSFGVVYVNETGRTSMFRTPPGVFPLGSVIVREKLANAAASTPDLLAVMVKRRTTFNAAANDWEFMILSGDGKKILKREKKGACYECHASQSQNDFVFPEK